MQRGSLTIVGTGIRFVSQITSESRQAIEQADHVFHLVDPPTAEWIQKTNPCSESLQIFYGENQPRVQAYQRMIDRILEFFRNGKNVCAAFYGHPGVLVSPSHQLMRQARLEGYSAVMLPGISTMDCLFADLGVDPRFGFQSFEATDFLVYERDFDPSCAVVLWQIDSIGDPTYREAAVGPNQGIHALQEVLLRTYGGSHDVILYRAAQMPLSQPMIQRIALEELSAIPLNSATVLFIPAKDNPTADERMMDALGLRSLD